MTERGSMVDMDVDGEMGSCFCCVTSAADKNAEAVGELTRRVMRLAEEHKEYATAMADRLESRINQLNLELNAAHVISETKSVNN